jgi:putative peptide zinc metalloprotease protein
MEVDMDAPAMTRPLYQFNPALTITSTRSQGEEMVLCEVPGAESTIVRYVIPVHLISMLRLFDGTRSVDDVIAECGRRDIRTVHRYSATQIAELIDGFCVPRGLLTGGAITPAAPRAGAGANVLYAKVTLLSHRMVYPIARALNALYLPWVMIAGFIATIVTHILFYTRWSPQHGLNINNLYSHDVVLVVAITIVAAMCHELGHATALARFDCRRLEIGIGLYIYHPVLYTDVSEAWRLEPTQRALVDIGGIYFHALFELILFAAFFLGGPVALLYAIWPIDLAIAMSLNPFFRMDGYWLAADLFGMWNPRQQSIQLLKSLWRRLLGQPVARDGGTAVARWTVATYTVLSVLFFGYMTVVMVQQLAFNVIPNYPLAWGALITEVQAHGLAHGLDLAGRFLDIVWKSILLFGCGTLAWRALLRVWSFALR